MWGSPVPPAVANLTPCRRHSTVQAFANLTSSLSPHCSCLWWGRRGGLSVPLGFPPGPCARSVRGPAPTSLEVVFGVCRSSPGVFFWTSESWCLALGGCHSPASTLVLVCPCAWRGRSAGGPGGRVCPGAGVSGPRGRGPGAGPGGLSRSGRPAPLPRARPGGPPPGRAAGHQGCPGGPGCPAPWRSPRVSAAVPAVTKCPGGGGPAGLAGIGPPRGRGRRTARGQARPGTPGIRPAHAAGETRRPGAGLGETRRPAPLPREAPLATGPSRAPGARTAVRHAPENPVCRNFANGTGRATHLRGPASVPTSRKPGRRDGLVIPISGLTG
jgi:hypothetical protein